MYALDISPNRSEGLEVCGIYMHHFHAIGAKLGYMCVDWLGYNPPQHSLHVFYVCAYTSVDELLSYTAHFSEV